VASDTTTARPPWWLIVLVAGGGVLLDQACKLAALRWLDPAHPVPLLGGLVRLELVFNSGAAFSMGEGATVVFAIAALVVIVGIVVFALPRLTARWQGVIAGLLLAGIAGNFLDRLCRAPGPFRGRVVDFIALPYFAVINVADILITCTAVVIAAKLLFPGKGAVSGTAGTDDADAGESDPVEPEEAGREPVPAAPVDQAADA